MVNLDDASIVAIVCMGIIFVFVITTCWNIASSLRRNGVSSTNNEGFVFAPDQDPSNEGSVGLDRQVIEALPILVYKSHGRFKGGQECAICLSEFGDDEKVRLLPSCNHCFHRDCIELWFHSHSCCPVCRTTVQPNPSSSSLNLENEIGRNNLVTAEPISSSISFDEVEEQDAASKGDQGTSGATPLPQIAIHIPNS